ncbi:hypothetical protein BDZ89DRAFT_236065 [Hymenopellis radicata]|nr:hypothetical protein BDZ89DRAFT_236065 [Hymenopellis radicata]
MVTVTWHPGFWPGTPCSPDSLEAHKGPDPRLISLMPTHPHPVGEVGSHYAYDQHGFMVIQFFYDLSCLTLLPCS